MPMEFEVTGRIVWGHPMRQTPKLDNNRQPQLKADGKPRMVRSFGLAVPTAEFAAKAWPVMHAEAATGYPNAANMGNGFAWKFKTPEMFDKQGKPYSEREGYAGHVVLSVSSELDTPPPLYRQNPNGQFVQMGPDEIKCGDYVFVRIQCALQKPKQATHTPSLYINPMILIFAGYGAEILSAAVDPNQLFAGRTFGIAPGASATPLAPTMAAAAPMAQPSAPTGPAGMPGATPMAPGGFAQPGMAPPAAPMAPGGFAPPSAPAGMPGMAAAPVQPAHGFVANAGQPTAGYPGMTPAAAAQPIPFGVPGR